MIYLLKNKVTTETTTEGPWQRIRTLVGDFLLKNAFYKNRILILQDKGGHYTGEKMLQKNTEKKENFTKNTRFKD